MAHILKLRGLSPKWGEGTWMAENATLVGDVVMGRDCSLWFHAVVRGDVNAIRMGDRVNVQDGAVIHCTYQRTQTHIGNDVSIGHNAIVHGCVVEDRVLLGMGSIVMDNALVRSETLVAAGAVLLEGTKTESGYIYAGVPAKRIKKIDAEVKGILERTARNYIQYAGWFKNPESA
ncbi:MAG: gamma carbonic anhydrase family protein [Cytophagales bacterium]|nr:gamma carbonic anhydrase family protein [Cytophagales bacterium]